MSGKIKKILLMGVWILAISMLMITLGFVSSEQDKLTIKSIEISIKGEEEHNFVDEDDIMNILHSKGNVIRGVKLKDINIPFIERILNEHPSIQTAEVYASINGCLNISIVQKKPIIRLFNNDGESYYIDDSGKVMPLSDKYTARVIVVSGNINEPYVKWVEKNIDSVMVDSVLAKQTLIDDVYMVSRFVIADSLWNALFVQVFVNESNEIELIPRIGDHKILLGDLSGLEDKFNKLKIFYEEGLGKTGWWDKYEIISLKYKNQVVCSKKKQHGNI